MKDFLKWLSQAVIDRVVRDREYDAVSQSRMQAARAVLQAADGTRQGVRWLALAVLAGLFVGMALWSLLTGLFALLFTIWFRDGLALMLGMLCSGLVGLIALVAVCYFTSEEYVMELLLKNRYSGPLIRRALADAQRILHK
jgi:hypothetical protein